jgi:hypothetical protein
LYELKLKRTLLVVDRKLNLKPQKTPPEIRSVQQRPDPRMCCYP